MEDNAVLNLRPIGEVIFVSGQGRDRRNHYQSFEYNGNIYRVEDTVLCEPPEETKKPYVAVIKEITETPECDLQLTVQWFYRPEDARTRGGTYKSRFSRELLYSFHIDEVSAESVMHVCIVHFIPLNKQVPDRLEQPGFVVQRVYDFKRKTLYNLTDRDYEDKLQNEIDLLVQKTSERLGYLPDIVPEGIARNRETKMKSKPRNRRRDMSSLDVHPVDGEPKFRSPTVETPGSTAAINLDCKSLLLRYNLLTTDGLRNHWLVKLLESISSKGTSLASVSAVADLEKAVHSAFSADFQKYKRKMLQLEFNLKRNNELAQRLLNEELDPEQILNMSPSELKAALTEDEMKSRLPEELNHEELNHVQMTDAHCKRCRNERVALASIYQMGGRSRYELECMDCGKLWHADAGTVTILGPATSTNTADPALKDEFDEMNLASPSEGDPMTETS